MIVALTALLVLQAPNTLTTAEKKAGWRLLFDGQTTKGWRNFKAQDIKPGWTVKDGALTCSDPHNAGDIMTKDQFDWFELTLDYNIGKGENSGIMYHVTEQGEATWHTGPEIQLFDNPSNPEVQKAGWLYQLYQSKVDATKPAGEWNHVRILVTPAKCQTDMNGVKYYEYVLGSEDFKARLAKSKFATMPYFAKSMTGSIAFQGDHGLVSFRNIKIRRIPATKTAGL
jgi:hypothetical protein